MSKPTDKLSEEYDLTGLVTTKQAIEITGKGRATLYAAARRGELIPYAVEGLLFWNEAQVRAWPTPEDRAARFQRHSQAAKARWAK